MAWKNDPQNATRWIEENRHTRTHPIVSYIHDVQAWIETPSINPRKKKKQREDTGMSLWGDACLPTFLALVVLQHLFDHGPGNPDVSRTRTDTVASPGLVWKATGASKECGFPYWNRQCTSWVWNMTQCLSYLLGRSVVRKKKAKFLGASTSFFRVISRGC